MNNVTIDVIIKQREQTRNIILFRLHILSEHSLRSSLTSRYLENPTMVISYCKFYSIIRIILLFSKSLTHSAPIVTISKLYSLFREFVSKLQRRCIYVTTHALLYASVIKKTRISYLEQEEYDFSYIVL